MEAQGKDNKARTCVIKVLKINSFHPFLLVAFFVILVLSHFICCLKCFHFFPDALFAFFKCSQFIIFAYLLHFIYSLLHLYFSLIISMISLKLPLFIVCLLMILTFTC